MSENKNFSDSDQEEYQYVRVLGRGAFGEAALYRKTEDNSLVVWKEISLRGSKKHVEDSALHEIDILALLDHANIITYYNHYIDDKSLFIEMEYADGGTLHDKIVRQQRNGLFDEETVLWYVYQLASAVSYIHDFDIIHRDIKSLNVFMTKSEMVKLGDFGISKVLEDDKMATSIVGTPYYMSPELIRGEAYDQKSDVWAVGCIVYELLTLSKTFNATNQLKLASEIVRGDIKEIDEKYSQDLSLLIQKMLHKEQSQRPTMNEVIKSPLLSKRKEEFDRRIDSYRSSVLPRIASNVGSNEAIPIVKSTECDVYYWGGGKFAPQKLDIFKGENQAIRVSAGKTHFAVVTVEKGVFTWSNAQGGIQITGQLGHSDMASYRVPKRVEALQNVPIKQVECGEEFTIFLSENGKLYSCGSNYYGCLGLSDSEVDEEETVVIPTMIRSLCNIQVSHVACGDCHVLILTAEKEIFSWGCGEYGRLGLNCEDDFAAPQKVKLPSSAKGIIKSISCGLDFSFLLTISGRVIAFGNNDHNQLGLNQLQNNIKRNKLQQIAGINCCLSPKLVRALNRFHIIFIAAGSTHTGLIDKSGRLITMGSNKYGERGIGNFKQIINPTIVSGVLSGKEIHHLTCGDSYTVIATKGNQLYSCGRFDNGRLGIVLPPSEKVANNGWALPRPIFGSLHYVPSMCSNYWHTIVVAEKILNSRKVVKSTNVAATGIDHTDAITLLAEQNLADPNLLLSDNFSEDRLIGNIHSDSGIPSSEDIRFSQIPMQDDGRRIDLVGENSVPKLAIGTQSSMSQSDIPEWLRDEVQDAEHIPIVAKSDVDTRSTLETPITNTFKSMDDSCDEAMFRLSGSNDYESSDYQITNYEDIDVDSLITGEESIDRIKEVIKLMLLDMKRLKRTNDELRKLILERDMKIAAYQALDTI